LERSWTPVRIESVALLLISRMARPTMAPTHFGSSSRARSKARRAFSGLLSLLKQWPIPRRTAAVFDTIKVMKLSKNFFNHWMQACMLRFWKGKGTKAFSLWQRAPYEKVVNFYWSISRAPRQWQGATEAIASVASVKYQACWMNPVSWSIGWGHRTQALMLSAAEYQFDTRQNLKNATIFWNEIFSG
jgi:hypothetical protein